jgi:hypothetical protein
MNNEKRGTGARTAHYFLFFNVSNSEENEMNPKRLVYVAALLVMSLGLVSCEKTKIGDIIADPGSFKGKEVAIVGEVTNAMGASIAGFSKGAYEIDDGTGKLWVVSNDRGVPSKGAHVGVKGKVSQSVTVMGRNFATVMMESDRRLDKGR